MGRRRCRKTPIPSWRSVAARASPGALRRRYQPPKLSRGCTATAKPLLMVTDPPSGIELGSEWRDRAGLNGCGPAEPSYMKKRTQGNTETSISGYLCRLVGSF